MLFYTQTDEIEFEKERRKKSGSQERGRGDESNEKSAKLYFKVEARPGLTKGPMDPGPGLCVWRGLAAR